jgi:zinc-binding alcohol dehydrogenase family protein
MKAIGYTRAGPVDVLVDFEAPTPSPGPRDLLVSVHAVSVNPVDTKVRRQNEPPSGETNVLGYDAAGIVKAVGSQASLFKTGDEVFYAGAINRSGTNAEYHVVDERIVGPKPKTVSFAEAAALPLTAITAWEMLFDRLRVPYGVKKPAGTLLVLAGAGGVGSIMIQLARKLTGLTIIVTASRPETLAWVRKMGAHHVVNHHQPLPHAIRALDIQYVDYIAAATTTPTQFPEIAEIIAPQGHVVLIDDFNERIMPLKAKSVTVSWEMMFTRSLFQTADMEAQHRLLREVSELIDAGVLKTTLTDEIGPINATNLRRAHSLIESGKAIGKTVLSGF